MVPQGYEDTGLPLLVLFALFYDTYRLYGLSRVFDRRAKRGRNQKRRFLSWNDEENIRYHQQKRATTGMEAVQDWLDKQNLGETK